MASSEDHRPEIVLNSPVGAKSATYKWPLTYVSKGQKIDGAEEIVETIRWVGREFPELEPAIKNLLPDRLDSRSYDCIKTLCDKYNKILDSLLRLNRGTSVAPKTSSRASQGLLKHIIQQVYNYAVADPAELNKYSPFSSETYGETNFDFMAYMIEKKEFTPREQDIFIDLGSGVGHLVLQMAASVNCKKCYGIEISDVPAGFAKVMTERFKFWMKWHGKTYSDFELFHGDFFDKRYTEIIKSAAYILVNNYAFKPDVDHKLKQKFLDLKEGVQILSSRAFCSTKQPHPRVTERRLTDIGSIMSVRPIVPELKKDTVSWTPKPVPYYLHIIDGARVEKYYERKKKRQGRAPEKGRPNKRRKIGKGSDESDDSDDQIVYGPTTRKAWSEWLSANANNRASADSIKSSRNNSTDTENYESAIENEDKEVASKPKENDNQKREKRAQDSQQSADDRSAITAQGISAQPKTSQSASQAAKSCLDKKRDYASKKTTPSTTQNEKSYSCLTKTAPEVSNGSSPSKVPPLVIKVTPPVETKVPEEATKTASPGKVESSKPEIKAVVNDENGKQLRQRKKPTSAVQSATTTVSTSSSRVTSKSETKKPQQAATATANANSSGTRVAKRAQQTNSKPSAKTPAISSKKRAMPSDKNSSLDLLHAKTVESVSGSAGYFPQPAPGCEDHSLRAIVETPSLPKVVVKNMDLFINEMKSSKMNEQCAEILRNGLEAFANRFQQPVDRTSLEREFQAESYRQKVLMDKIRGLELHNRELDERLTRCIIGHCNELGIQDTSHRGIANYFAKQLKKHEELKAISQRLEAFHSNQRTCNPPAAHSSSSQCLPSPYHRSSASSATLDLSLKQGA